MRPNLNANSGVSSLLATPRTPSVPKYLPMFFSPSKLIHISIIHYDFFVNLTFAVVSDAFALIPSGAST